MWIDWEVTKVVGEETSEDRLGGDKGCGRSD